MVGVKYTASVSFGKDSLAMLLILIEEKYPLDEVFFYNTGMEFQAIYDIRDKVKEILKQHNITFTEIKPSYDFEWKMFEKPVNGKNGFHYGYSWCGEKCRWGTRDKIRTIEKTYKGCMQYVGIAFDELNRIEKEKRPNKIFPLVDRQMTEKDCLNYCYDHGFYWEEHTKNGIVRLYDVLSRVSCWCCSNKNLKELENIYNYLPEYWEKLKYLQSRTNRPMKPNKTVFDLEKIFKERKENNNG